MMTDTALATRTVMASRGGVLIHYRRYHSSGIGTGEHWFALQIHFFVHHLGLSRCLGQPWIQPSVSYEDLR